MKKIFALTFAAAMACATSAFAECATGDHGAISIQNIDGVCTAVIYGDATASDAYNILDKFSATVDSVYYYKGKTTKNAAQSIVLPFSVKPGCNKEGLSFHTIQKIYKNNNQKWVVYAPDIVDVEKNGLSANTPYLIKVESGDMFFKLGGEGCSFEINTDASVTELPYDGESGLTGSWLFKGTYETIQWNAGDSELGYVYGLSSKNVSYANGDKDSIKVGQFVKAAAGASITPLRAYLRYVPKKAVGMKMKSLASTEETVVDGEQDDVIDVVLGRSADAPAVAFKEGEDCFEEGDDIIEFKMIGGARTACIEGQSDARLQTLSIPEDVVVDSIKYNRVFKKETFSTVMFPFGGKLYEVFFGAIFYEAVDLVYEYGKWLIKFWEVGNVQSAEMKANTPYVIRVPDETQLNSDNTLPFCKNVSGGSCATLNTTTGGNKTASFGAWQLRGTYEKLEYGKAPFTGYAYGFAAKDKDGVSAGEFVKAKSGASVPPMRAYLKYVGAATKTVAGVSVENELPETIEIMLVDKDGVTQAIGSMNTLTGEIKMDENVWFDMKGRKMNKKPTVKGTYYNKGQKVIIK